MKLTKEQTKKHEEAMALLKIKRDLHNHEREFFFEHFHPAATNNVTKSGAFFTPDNLAMTFGQFAGISGRTLDACAGIGILSYYSMFGTTTEVVAVEINPEYVEIGQKVMPELNWVQGDIFSQPIIDKIGHFRVGISNPPFGHVPSKQHNPWFKYKGPAHMMVAELLMRKCELGATMIIPAMDHSQEDSGRGERHLSANYERFRELFPEAFISPHPICTKDCGWKGANPKCAVVDLGFQEADNVYFEGVRKSQTLSSRVLWSPECGEDAVRNFMVKAGYVEGSAFQFEDHEGGRRCMRLKQQVIFAADAKHFEFQKI